MVEPGPGRPKILVRRHFLEIEKETRAWLDEKIDAVLELARIKIAVDPVSATLGNPVAFPILAGGFALVAAVVYLKLRFPDPLAQAEQTVREVAEDIAKAIEETKATEKGFELTQPLIDATRDLLLRIWKDPLFGFGGQGPFLPGV